MGFNRQGTVDRNVPLKSRGIASESACLLLVICLPNDSLSLLCLLRTCRCSLRFDDVAGSFVFIGLSTASGVTGGVWDVARSATDIACVW